MRPLAPQPVYFRGNARTGSLTEPPFAPVTVRPVVSFSRFNPLLNQSFNLPAGAVLTMFTELKVENAPSLTLVWLVWLVGLAIVLFVAAALVARKRKRPQG